MALFRFLPLVVPALLIHIPGNAQDYMEEIVKKSCSCVNAVPENDDRQRLSMQMGVCIIEAAMPYRKQLRKDHGIDMGQIETAGEKLGRIIGVRMASVCPDVLLKVASLSEESASPVGQQVEGVVMKIETDFFVSFFIKDDSGKTARYYWLTAVETAADLANEYEALLNKRVTVGFVAEELFDPRLKEYRPFHVIRTLEVVQ